MKISFKNILVSALIIVGVLSPMISWAQHSSRSTDTNYVVEYSLMGLKNSAQQMADRNAWLVSQINQLKEQLPALQQRLSVFEGEKEKLQLLSQDNLSSQTLKKYVTASKGNALIKDQAGMNQEQQILEQKINEKESESQTLKESKATLEDDIHKLEYELNLLNVEVKASPKKDDWQDLVRQREQGLKSLRNAQRTLSQLEGQDNKPLVQIKSLEAEQKSLQNRLGQLENDINISFNQDNDVQQQILNVRGQHAQRMTQLNQEVDQLKQKLQEMENTLSQARTKIKEKNISLNTQENADKDLQQSLNLINQENMALKGEISSLKESLSKIESLR